MSKILLVTGASSEIGTALIQKIEPMYDVIYAHYNNTSKNVDELKKNMGIKSYLSRLIFQMRVKCGK